MIVLHNEVLIKKRVITFLFLILISEPILVVRMGYVTFYLLDNIAPMVYDQRTRDIPIECERGNIYDRNGKLIVGNMLSPSVAVIKRQITDVDYVAN